MNPLGQPRHYPLTVVVTYNSMEQLPSVCEALLQWLELTPDGRVVFIENSQSVATVDFVTNALEKFSPQSIAVLNPFNSGFAPAVNRAVEMARNEWGFPGSVLLLNPDVVTDGETIGSVLDRLDDHVGIVVPKLLDCGGAIDRGVARREWNKRRLLAEVIGRPNLARFLGTRNRQMELNTEEVEVDIASGAFMAISASVFSDGLDTRLPMYLEDQEICHRAHRAGKAVLVLTNLRATHLGGLSRKSNVAAKKRLRMLELAEAPVISMMDSTGDSLGWARSIIFLGGLFRAIGASALFTWSLVRRNQDTQWFQDQLVLAGWFMGWALTYQPTRSHRIET